MSRSYFELLERCGLDPKRRGDVLDFYCPSCEEDGRERRGKSRNAYIMPNSEWWNCRSADHYGPCSTLAGMSNVGGAWSPVERRHDRRRTLEDVETIGELWGRLKSNAPDSKHQDIRSWLTNARGWPEGVVVDVADWTEITTVDLGLLARWRREMDVGHRGFKQRFTGVEVAHIIDVMLRPARSTHTILVPIRDGSGEIVNFTQQWSGVGEKPQSKRKQIDANVVGSREGAAFFGNVVDVALEAKGQKETAQDRAKRGKSGDVLTIVVTEGLPDTMAALALFRPLGAEVLGTVGSSAEACAAAISQQLGDHQTTADVILIKQQDGGAGAKWLKEMTDVLNESRCGVRVIDMAKAHDVVAEYEGVKVNRKGVPVYDLADWIEDGGTVEALLDLAERRHGVPYVLSDLRGEEGGRGGIMVEYIRDAVSHASHDWINQRSISVVEFPAGAGKSRAALSVANDVAQNQDPDIAVKWIGDEPEGGLPDGRRVFFAMPSHELAAEKVQEFREHHGIDATHIKGLLQHCRFAESKAVRKLYGSVGRRGLCGDPGSPQRCKYAETCMGAVDPVIEPGRVAFGYHKMDVQADLVIIDENPGLIDKVSIDDSEVASLFDQTRFRLGWWRKNNRDASDLCEVIHDVIDKAAREFRKKGERHPSVLMGDKVRDLLDGVISGYTESTRKPTDQQMKGFMEAVNRGFIGEDATAPRPPDPEKIRSGKGVSSYPSVQAYRVIKQLVMWMWGPDLDGHELAPGKRGSRVKPAPIITLEVGQTGTSYQIDIWSVAEPPNAPTVMLDATGSLVAEGWQRSRREDFRIFKTHMAGRSPLKAVWYKTPAFSKNSMAKEPGMVGDRLFKALSETLRRNRHLLRSSPRPVVGIITHKVIADALRGVDAEAWAADVREAVEKVKQLAEVEIHEEIGHYGLHDRGFNMYEEVDALVTIGDPNPNLGISEIEAEFLQLEDGDAYYTAARSATVIQAMARTRYATRKTELPAPLLVYIGSNEPDVPDVYWGSPICPPSGPPISVSMDINALAAHILREVGVVGDAVIRWYDRSATQYAELDVDALSPKTIQRAADGAGRARGWGAHYIPTPKGRLKIVARTETDALRWVHTHYSTNV